jgi:hypothetical protein
VISQIDVENCDLMSLFTFRFALDDTNDVVDLKQDIRDLTSFPERLYSSYEAEWRVYVKRKLHALDKAPKHKQVALVKLLNKLENDDDENYIKLREIINTAIKVNNSSSVTVMTTPLKSYVNYLLTL